MINAIWKRWASITGKVCVIILRALGYEPLVPGPDGEKYFEWRRP